MRRLVALLLLAVAAAGRPALADPQPQHSKEDRDKAAAIYEQAVKHYNAGEYDQAIEEFRQAYYLSGEALLLFNIAQAFRLKGDCEQALHSYKAYLREVPDPDNRKQVDEAVGLCEQKLKEEADARAAKERAQAAHRDSGGHKVAAAGGDEGDEGDDEITGGEETPVTWRRHLFESRAAVGPGFAAIGQVDTSVLLSAALGFGYAFELGGATVEPGVVFTYTPVPWKGQNPAMSDIHGTAGLTAILANFGTSIRLGGPVSARIDAGAGVLVLSGITRIGNPFLNPDERATGALSMFHARVAAGIEVAVGRDVTLSLQPVASYSPTKDLRDDIKSIRRIDVLLGASVGL